MNNEQMKNLKEILDTHPDKKKILFSSNPLLSDLNGFSYGIEGTYPDYLQYFSQNSRVDMLNKAVVEILDIEFLKEEGLIVDYSAIHNLKDLDIFKTHIAHPKFAYKYLTDEELVMSS